MCKQVQKSFNWICWAYYSECWYFIEQHWGTTTLHLPIMLSGLQHATLYALAPLIAIFIGGWNIISQILHEKNEYQPLAVHWISAWLCNHRKSQSCWYSLLQHSCLCDNWIILCVTQLLVFCICVGDLMLLLATVANFYVFSVIMWSCIILLPHVTVTDSNGLNRLVYWLYINQWYIISIFFYSLFFFLANCIFSSSIILDRYIYRCRSFKICTFLIWTQSEIPKVIKLNPLISSKIKCFKHLHIHLNHCSTF